MALRTALVVAIATAIVAHVVYSSVLWPFWLSPLKTIPTVPGFPLWGQSLALFDKEVGVPQRRWHEQLGPVVRFHLPFGSERLSIADDDAIKEVTVRDPYNYPKPKQIRNWMSQVLGERGILLAEGEEHARQRKVLSPAFSTSAVQQLWCVFWQKSLRLVAEIDSHVDANAGVASLETLDPVNRMTLDIICVAGFGEEIHSLENPRHDLREAYRSLFGFDLVSRATLALMTFSIRLSELPLDINKKVQDARAKIVAFANTALDESKAPGQHQSRSIISRVRTAQTGGGGGVNTGDLSKDVLRDQIMTFLGAGHDTTATGIAWTLDQLAKYPHIQRRLRDEIRRCLPQVTDAVCARASEPQTERASLDSFARDIDNLPYLDKVCRESLRFIPPIPLTLRRSRRVATLGGHQVPAGTLIFIAANTVNRLSRFWGPTADNFDPDRWDDLPRTWRSSAYMTFLAGPRGCIGRRFAEVEMKVALCCLVAAFEFHPDPRFDDQEKWKMWRLVLRPRDGINLEVRRWSQDSGQNRHEIAQPSDK